MDNFQGNLSAYFRLRNLHTSYNFPLWVIHESTWVDDVAPYLNLFLKNPCAKWMPQEHEVIVVASDFEPLQHASYEAPQRAKIFVDLDTLTIKVKLTESENGVNEFVLWTAVSRFREVTNCVSIIWYHGPVGLGNITIRGSAHSLPLWADLDKLRKERMSLLEFLGTDRLETVNLCRFSDFFEVPAVE